MASTIQRKKSTTLNVILSVNTDTKTITVEGDGIDEPMNLADIINDFNGLDVKISITQSEDVV